MNKLMGLGESTAGMLGERPLQRVSYYAAHNNRFISMR
jgi:hypothetical protein